MINFNYKLFEKKISKLKKKNKIVMAHGVFDVFHYGHLKHLQAAKQLGDILVVSVTSDQFVNKGPNRPFFDLSKRIEMLKSFKFIDFVIPSFFETAEKNLHIVKPNLYVKGNDYLNKGRSDDKNLFKEISTLKKNKGKIKIIDEIQFSSSRLINNLELPKSYQKIFKKLYKRLNFNQIVNSLDFNKDEKVLVVGDFINDEFIFSKSLGKSRKNNLISTRFVKKEMHDGGIIMIFKILMEFFKNIQLILYGNKQNFVSISKVIPKKKILFCNIEQNSLVTKTRFVDSYDGSKLFQLNRNDALKYDGDKKRRIISFCKKIFFSKKIKNFIVADFGQGYLFDEVIELINKSTKKKYINCQANSSNYGYNLFSKYNRSEHITCDEDEYRLVNKNATEQLSDGLIRFGKQMKNLKINNLLVTAGKNGCYHLKREKQNIKINFLESIKSNKFIDSIGSGDAFFAYYCVLSITKKFTNLEILSFCHLAASMHCENFANSKYINKKDFLKSLKYFTKIS